MRNRHEIGRKTGQMSKEKQKRGLRTSTIAHALWQSAHAQTLDAHHDTRCTSDESMHTHFLKRRRRVLCCIFLLGRATNECTCACVIDVSCALAKSDIISTLKPCMADIKRILADRSQSTNCACACQVVTGRHTCRQRHPLTRISSKNMTSQDMSE
jgi:hypothetical protein